MRAIKALFLLLIFSGLAHAQVGVSELQSRRRSAMEKCSDGIILIHANSGMKHWDEAGFHQDPNFYYFTGLANAQGAILAIDGTARESTLFVPPRAKRGFASLGYTDKGMLSVYFPPGPEQESALKIEHVVSWDNFAAFIDSRRARNPKLVIYADSSGQTGAMMLDSSNPPELGPIENSYLLWRTALTTRWPDLLIRDAFPILDEVRSVKSSAEVDLLRKAAAVTAEGFWAGVRAIGPGRTQRQVEAAVVQGCMEAGSNGPSLWPWVKSGPNGLGSKLFDSFFDYSHLDRTMSGGEMVRLDIGCDYEMYKGDFGRTIPVSGRFGEGEKETMELLNGAYLAGVKVMRDGANSSEIIKASIAYVEQHQTGLKTVMAKTAAANALKQGNWPLHGLGLDMAEGAPKVLRAGNVVCYEPLFFVDAEAFFVEDTFLITKDGYEILNPALPYAADDLERAIAKVKKEKPDMNR